MKKTRVLKKNSQYQNPNIADFDNPISREIVKKRPTSINDDGFTAFIRKMKPTEDGMESEVQEPLLIDKLGRRVKENEIQGRCDVCGGYVLHILSCYVQGCKKSLCRRHVYFFNNGDKDIPYCIKHYEQVVSEFDTWQAYENRRKLKKENEKQ